MKEIRNFIARHSLPPTIQELAEVLGIKTSSVHGQVNHLVNKGYLKRVPHKARGLMIVREPEDDIVNLIPVPVIGAVAADKPILARENVVGEVLVEGKLVKSGLCFALGVRGDSMIGAGIHEGDLVIVRQQPVAESGDVIVALLGDETTVKRLYIRDEQIELRPESPGHQAIPITPHEDMRILGKVVAIRRSDSTNTQRPRPSGC